MSLYSGFRLMGVLINNLKISHKNVTIKKVVPLLSYSCNKIHTSCVTHDLMEFFDSKENWTEREVPVGRSWKLEELRIKSNSDLHKLWYVLLKERNMLMTMEHEYNAKYEAFPNPERLDKVEESMKNLETVVRERNRAYHELETGQSGEREIVNETNCFGLPYTYKAREYLLPKECNKKYWELYNLNNKTTDYTYVKDFLTRLDEKRRRIADFSRKRRYHAVCKLLSIFPNIDEEALKERFPDIDIEEAKRDKLSRGHRENKY